MSQRILLILIALDVFLFALFCLGKVKRGECASSAAWDLLIRKKWQGRLFVPIIDALFFFDPLHCHQSWLGQRQIYQDAP